jgi:hypothetical protein
VLVVALSSDGWINSLLTPLNGQKSRPALYDGKAELPPTAKVKEAYEAGIRQGARDAWSALKLHNHIIVKED